jgi:hypothetical protein
LIMSTGGFMIVWIAFTAVFIVWAREASRDEVPGRARYRRVTPIVPVAANGAHGYVDAVRGHTTDALPAGVSDEART